MILRIAHCKDGTVVITLNGTDIPLPPPSQMKVIKLTASLESIRREHLANDE